MSPRELFEQVEVASPSFRAVARQHLSDNRELLPHVLMADLLRHVGAFFESSHSASSPSEAEVKAIMALLDSSLAEGGGETANIIAVSFLENIDAEPFFTRLKPFLGLALRRELMSQSEWRPGK